MHPKFTGATNHRLCQESLFNILNNRINFEECKLLELFAGTGNIGYEFASRGCEEITSVDVNFKCIQFIKRMNKELQFNNRVIRSEAIRFLNQCKAVHFHFEPTLPNERYK